MTTLEDAARSFVSVLAQNRLTWDSRKRNSSTEKDPRGPNSSRHVLLLEANYLGTSVSKQQSRLPKQSGGAPNAVRHEYFHSESIFHIESCRAASHTKMSLWYGPPALTASRTDSWSWSWSWPHASRRRRTHPSYGRSTTDAPRQSRQVFGSSRNITTQTFAREWVPENRIFDEQHVPPTP